jgi:hypothetical protein
VALVDVAARSQQQLEALGVAVLGGSVNRRNAVVVALVDVAARSQQQLEALGVAVRGGSVNRRKTIDVALVDVAARSNNLFGPVGKPKGFHYHVALVLVLVSACVDEVVEGMVCGVINIYI